MEGRGWTRVDELVPGDLVPSATNGILTVNALEWTDRAEIVYNFGVDEFHTYFVGESGAWVHNCAFGQAFQDMSSSARKSLQHLYGRHGKELGLPNWQQTRGEDLRKRANAVIGHIRKNAQETVVEPWPYGIKGSGKAGTMIDATVHIWTNPQNSIRYYVTETAAGGFVSAGVRK